MEENAKNNKQTNEKVVKQETIMDTANTKETGMRNKKEKSKTRKWLVILFLIVLDKQESLETIYVLTIRCRELQQQTAKLEQDLNAQTGKEQTSQEELEQLKKVIRSLKQMLITIINCIQKPNKKPWTVSNN